MEPKQLQARLMVLRGGLLVGLAVLVGRLWYLQIARWADYEQDAEANRTTVTWTPAPRGTIYDRNGEALADNQVVYQIQVTPLELPPEGPQFDAAVVPVARALKVSTVGVKAAIQEARKLGAPEAVLPGLGENIDRAQAIRLDEHRLEMPGIRVVEARRRHYPFGSLAAHVIGYARAITPEQYHEVEDLVYEDPPGGPDNRPQPLVREQKVYAQDSIYGQTGVESLCELVRINGRLVPALQGRRGGDELERDAFNEPRLIRHLPPTRGASVYLTLDRRLQQVAEVALARPFPYNPSLECGGGAAVLIDVRTGDVVAIASHPRLDLNQYVVGFKGDEWEKARTDARHPALNRALAGLYPPASTFKIITGCAILERTGVNLNTTYTCTGHETFGRRERKTCWKEAGHGTVSFNEAVAQSCDVYFWDTVKYAGLSAEDIAEYAQDFGLGQLTGCGLLGERQGVVPTPALRKAAGKGRWYQGDTANLVIGQGELQVTPLQMALATAAVANRGVLPRARVVKKIVWPDETGLGAMDWPAEPSRRLHVRAETLDAVRRGMRATVTSSHGTARLPMAGLPVSVAAKTGSAEALPSPKPHSWFVWFAPYEQPKYACAVIVEHGGYGSEVAGYVARRILLAAFGQGGSSATSLPPKGTSNAG